MGKTNILFAIWLVGVFCIVGSDWVFARGIMGYQPGDRSPEENEQWLKVSMEQLQAAIQSANEGNRESAIESGKASMTAIKEISSEGWDGMRQRSVRFMRQGISAAKKGDLDKAAQDFQDALNKLGDLEYGDMNFTHESFLGIGAHKDRNTHAVQPEQKNGQSKP
ncbi:MAG: hypothetical protein ACRERV_15335 [Methylococcales bacterium]